MESSKRTDGHGADPLPGQLLKQTYRIVRRIAAGGMGAVYEAEHVRLHRRVAVKIVLPNGKAEDRLVERFTREVEAIAQVGHPHIVQVIDFDRMESGAPYLVMEYLEGETLEALVDRVRRLSVESALDITSQIAAALADVHARGIIHRDLKPANIFLVEATGEHHFVKLLDFGVSQSTGKRRITGVREVVGTPEYIAPEQVQSIPFDHRVDQFALAAITYEMLAGRQAFMAEEVPAVIYQVLNVDPPRVSTLAPWVPDLIDDVLARALSKDPGRRYPTISQFAFALESAAARAGMRRAREPALHDASGSLAQEPAPTLRVVRESRQGAPGGGPQPRSNADPKSLFAAVHQARDAGDLETAVDCAERLLELGATEQDPAVLQVLERAMPVLDEVFQSYVGPLDRRIHAGPEYRYVREMPLSPRAAELLALMDGPARITAVFDVAHISERAGVRLLAGLMRRRVVERL